MRLQGLQKVNEMNNNEIKESVAKIMPSIKKDLKQFVSDESGIVTKENIVKAGLILGAAIAASGLASASHGNVNSIIHTNNMAMTPSEQTITGQHTHHSQHSDAHHSNDGGKGCTIGSPGGCF